MGPRRFDIELESAPHHSRRYCQVDNASGAAGHRCDVAMILMPKESDPPPPKQISDCVKARSILQRSRSLPPEPARNPITPESCDSGRSNNWDCYSSSRPMLFAATDVAELANHTLLSRETVETRAERLACEKKFADLCAITEATAPMGRQNLACLRNESSGK